MLRAGVSDIEVRDIGRRVILMKSRNGTEAEDLI